jgi:hypothetical protein
MKRVEDRDYLQMAVDKPGDVRREAACFRSLYQFIPTPFESVCELFAGSGLMRSVLDELFLVTPRTQYTMWDQSEACVRLLLTRYREPETKVVRGDSFEMTIPPRQDLLSADFNTWTAVRYFADGSYRHLTDRLFDSRPRMVQITDSAVGKYHLNSKIYTRALGLPVPTFPAYVRRLGAIFSSRYGYGLVRVCYHSSAAYMLFQEGVSPVDVPPLRIRA